MMTNFNNLTRAEQAAFNADFNRVFAAEHAAAKRDEAVEDSLDYKLNEALNDESIFATLDHGYEVVSAYHGNIMRALRNLDAAIKGDQVARDAVFTALSQMQDNIKRVLRDESEKEYDDAL